MSGRRNRLLDVCSDVPLPFDSARHQAAAEVVEVADKTVPTGITR